MTEWSHGYGFWTEIPHTDSIYSDRLSFPEINTDYSRNPHRLFPTVSELHKVSCRGPTSSHSYSLVEWRRIPPPRLISAILFAWAWIDTSYP
jgi:hypothetical protein